MNDNQVPKTKSKKEQDLDKFKSGIYDTVLGKRSINELNEELGLPLGVMQYARIEARTGSTRPITITVDRYIDGVLVYRPNITIKGIKESMMRQLEVNGLRTEFVRKPDYNPEKMPKATQKEYNDWAKKQREELHTE